MQSVCYEKWKAMVELSKVSDTINTWLNHIDPDRGRVSKSDLERREQLRVLVKTLTINLNMGKDDFSNSVKNLIIEACTNENYGKKDKLKIWRSMVMKDIDSAIAWKFPEQIAELTDEEKSLESGYKTSSFLPVYSKEELLDLTEFRDKIPKTEVVLDNELLKELGVDTDE